VLITLTDVLIDLILLTCYMHITLLSSRILSNLQSLTLLGIMYS